MKALKKTVAAAVITLSIVISISANAQNLETVGVNGSVTDHSLVAAVIDQTNQIYKKEGKDLWSVEVAINEEKTAVFFVQAEGDIATVSIVLSPAPETMSDELKNALLDMNNDFFMAKFVFDSKAVYIRMDALIYNLDGTMLNNMFSRILQIARHDKFEKLMKLLPKSEATKQK